ncbi:methylglyoxal synthase [Porphyromonadaceae bacterium W3.11]|nr:methylglyoxal synthase [Porphyromonadaceae bacterium W3.11]
MNKLTIALVAHDYRKVDMVEWALHNVQFLSKHNIVCTGTTGAMIQRAFKSRGYDIDIDCKNSGPLGGDAEIAAMVVRQEVNLAIFLMDDLNALPHEADIHMLLRQCRIHNVPIACNRYSADLMVTSSMWEEDYVPTPPQYIKFDREEFEKSMKQYEDDKA